MIDREPLDDHPSHRAAHDVGLADVYGVKHRDRVVGHIGEGVVGAVEFRRQADISIVESHDVKTFLAEQLAPFGGIVDAL